MERDGLFGLMQDLKEGKSVSLPSPFDLESIFAMHRARQSQARDRRDPAGDRLHASVIQSFGEDAGPCILERLGIRW